MKKTPSEVTSTKKTPYFTAARLQSMLFTVAGLGTTIAYIAMLDPKRPLASGR